MPVLPSHQRPLNLEPRPPIPVTMVMNFLDHQDARAYKMEPGLLRVFLFVVSNKHVLLFVPCTKYVQIMAW